MNKKFLATASALALILGFSSVANAGCDGIYLAGRGGVVKHKIDASILNAGKKMDGNQLMLSGALGYRYGYFRTELEYVWRDSSSVRVDEARDEFESSSYMWNVYWDLSPYTWFTPYFSAGIGFSKLEFSAHSGGLAPFTKSWDTTKFTWSLGGGISAQVTNRFNIDVGYRYYNLGSLKGADINAYEIYGGLRYVF